MRLTQSIMKWKFPSLDKPRRIKAPPKISPSKRAFEKYKLRGLFSEFYGMWSSRKVTLYPCKCSKAMQWLDSLICYKAHYFEINFSSLLPTHQSFFTFILEEFIIIMHNLRSGSMFFCYVNCKVNVEAPLLNCAWSLVLQMHLFFVWLSLNCIIR